MALLAKYFVHHTMYRLPSNLRETRYKEAWLSFFCSLNCVMRRGYPDQECVLSEKEKEMITETYFVIKTEVGNLNNFSTAGIPEQFALRLRESSTTKILGSQSKLSNIFKDPREEMAIYEALATHFPHLMRVILDLVTKMT